MAWGRGKVIPEFVHDLCFLTEYPTGGNADTLELASLGFSHLHLSFPPYLHAAMIVTAAQRGDGFLIPVTGVSLGCCPSLSVVSASKQKHVLLVIISRRRK